MQKLRPRELVCTLKSRHCPGMCSVVKKDLCQLLSSCPVIHVFSQPHARPSMLCSVTLVPGLRKLHFLFCRVLTVWLCQQDIPSSGGICAWPPEPLLSEMSAPVGSARLRPLSLPQVSSFSSFQLLPCSLGLPRGSELLPAVATSVTS